MLFSLHYNMQSKPLYSLYIFTYVYQIFITILFFWHTQCIFKMSHQGFPLSTFLLWMIKWLHDMCHVLNINYIIRLYIKQTVVLLCHAYEQIFKMDHLFFPPFITTNCNPTSLKRWVMSKRKWQKDGWFGSDSKMLIDCFSDDLTTEPVWSMCSSPFSPSRERLSG